MKIVVTPLGTLEVATCDPDPGPEAGKADRGGLADSPGSARDQDDLACHGTCVRHGLHH